MSIDAKRIDAAGIVSTIQLPDDPSDAQLSDALGGVGSLVTHCQIGGLDVLTTRAVGSSTLVVGQPPYVGATPARRRSCILTDVQATNLVKLVNEIWPLRPQNAG